MHPEALCNLGLADTLAGEALDFGSLAPGGGRAAFVLAFGFSLGDPGPLVPPMGATSHRRLYAVVVTSAIGMKLVWVSLLASELHASSRVDCLTLETGARRC